MSPNKVYINLNYRIEFFSEWHCGSGLSAGADTDALVIKDGKGLPYIPGRTLKGLFREAAEEIVSLTNEPEQSALLKETFGYFDESADKAQSAANMGKGDAFFSNAELPKVERDAIVSNGLQRHLYRRIAQTAIGDKGVAVEGSLRSMETVIPCVLEGQIRNIPAELSNLMSQSARYIKHLGVNRNRGLGRCQITLNQAD
jgi:CRISPR/Cas system CSM-associated protein Csm3 (group 7 of RAMP superfamily)